mmetsp:Transcript_37039/g.48681  ORF Transcript_37039/g.48681 Transcript_37039/m.48681 type:complete len:275 (+) Transcript_37039:859-1683(+)
MPLARLKCSSRVTSSTTSSATRSFLARKSTSCVLKSRESLSLPSLYPRAPTSSTKKTTVRLKRSSQRRNQRSSPSPPPSKLPQLPPGYISMRAFWSATGLCTWIPLRKPPKASKVIGTLRSPRRRSRLPTPLSPALRASTWTARSKWEASSCNAPGSCALSATLRSTLMSAARLSVTVSSSCAPLSGLVPSPCTKMVCRRPSTLAMASNSQIRSDRSPWHLLCSTWTPLSTVSSSCLTSRSSHPKRSSRSLKSASTTFGASMMIMPPERSLLTT